MTTQPAIWSGTWGFPIQIYKNTKSQAHDYFSKALQHTNKDFFFFFLSRNGLLQRYSSSIYFLNALLATTGKVYLSNYHFYIVSLHLNFVEINANLLNLTTDLCMCTYVCAWETGKEEGSPILLVKYKKKSLWSMLREKFFWKMTVYGKYLKNKLCIFSLLGFFSGSMQLFFLSCFV